MKLSDYVAAFERGATVQVQCHPPDGVWTDKVGNTWYESNAYRMKPKLFECWANTYAGGVKYYHSSEAEALLVASALPPIRRAVHMREVV